MFYLPPSLTAVVLILATSDPAPVSLTPRQATKSPAIVGVRNCCHSSLLPNLIKAGVVISAWTPMAMGTPPHFILPIKNKVKGQVYMTWNDTNTITVHWLVFMIRVDSSMSPITHRGWYTYAA